MALHSRCFCSARPSAEGTSDQGAPPAWARSMHGVRLTIEAQVQEVEVKIAADGGVAEHAKADHLVAGRGERRLAAAGQRAVDDYLRPARRGAAGRVRVRLAVRGRAGGVYVCARKQEPRATSGRARGRLRGISSAPTQAP